MNAHELVSKLQYNQVLEHVSLKNADGTPQRFKITALQIWKRDRNRLHIGLKRGMYQYESIDSIDEFFQHFTLPNDETCTTCPSVILRQR